MSDIDTSGEVSVESSQGECFAQNKPQSQISALAAENLENTGDSASNRPDSSGSEKAVPPLTADLPTASSQSNQTSQDGSVKVEESSVAVKSVSGEENSAEKGKDSSQKGEKQICTFYTRSGWCKFGRHCRYLHPKSKKQPRSTSTAEKAKAVEQGENGSSAASSEHDTSDGSKAESDSAPACRFYARAGWCRYGYKCRFAHVSKKSSEVVEGDGERGQDENLRETKDDVAQVTEATSNLHVDDKRRDKKKGKDDQGSSAQQTTCRFYAKGHCRMGKRCRFLHEKKPALDKNDAAKVVRDEPNEVGGDDWQPARKPVSAASITSRFLSELQDGDAEKMRETEIGQLKKRFPGDKLEVLKENDIPSYRFTVMPTDPDWPYDLRDFDVELTFPPDYPIQPLKLVLPEDQVLPSIILRHLSEATCEWLEARNATNKLSGRVELTVRPFLRWFDRSLMRLFTEGARKFKKEVYAKAAGMEFISYAKPENADGDQSDQTSDDAPAHPKEEFINQEMDRQEDEEGDDDEEEEEEDEGGEEEEDEGGEEEQSWKIESSGNNLSARSTSPSEGATPPAPKLSKYDSPAENRRGTEMRLQRLEMSESAAMLACEKIKLRIQCSRCKDQNDLSATPGSAMVLGCGKCQNQQAVGFRPCLVHQFSSVLGFLDLTGCLPVDLIIYECSFKVTCLECSHENNVQGIQYGQNRLMWCSQCHQKMSVSTENTRFQKLVASVPEGKTEVVATKKTRRVQDPAIKEGTPLPANGACKHYKKSFRWLRFPCCGKVYPCDECHDLEEMDHDMKFATRMICGFCSKEQPYSAEKPCLGCGSNTTKSRTTHWEGGTGCRNKTKMSRLDKQKFANVNKTKSRKAQKLEETKKGKKK